MKIEYITNSRIPTEKARGYQIIRTCEKFSKMGVDIELVIPNFRNCIKEETFSYYGVSKNFDIKKYLVIDLKFLNKIFPKFTYLVKQVTFLISLSFRYLFNSRELTIYTREVLIAWYFAKIGYRTIFECHFIPESNQKLFFKLSKKADLIITNSIGTKDEFLENNFTNVHSCPNGVELNDFDSIQKTKNELRDELDLSNDKKIVMYLGHYYTWKGTDILLKAAEKLDNNIELVLAGGTDLLDKEIINNLSNIKLVNTKKRDMVAKYLKSADILIITANKNSKESIKYTSPIKLFEYLASKVPVLAPEVESMTNIVTNKEVTFYEVDNVEDLVNKINNI